MRNLFAVLGVFLLSTQGMAEVSFEGAWARPSVEGKNTAIYGLLKSDERFPVFLEKAETAASKTVELHQTINENGVMKMRPVPRLECAPGETVLKPGGIHIMLIGLTANLVAGESVVPLMLTFSTGDVVTLNVPVRKNESK